MMNQAPPTVTMGITRTISAVDLPTTKPVPSTDGTMLCSRTGLDSMDGRRVVDMDEQLVSLATIPRHTLIPTAYPQRLDSGRRSATRV